MGKKCDNRYKVTGTGKGSHTQWVLGVREWALPPPGDWDAWPFGEWLLATSSLDYEGALGEGQGQGKARPGGVCWDPSWESSPGRYRHPVRVQRLAQHPLCCLRQEGLQGWRQSNFGEALLGKQTPCPLTQPSAMPGTLRSSTNHSLPLRPAYPLGWARGTLEVPGDSFFLPPPTALMLLQDLECLSKSVTFCGPLKSGKLPW